MQRREVAIQIKVPPDTILSAEEESEFKRKADVVMNGPYLQTPFHVPISSRIETSASRSLPPACLNLKE
jgi:hypothetical protein